MFFALFIVTLFTASFSLGRYSSIQSSESNYDDDFEYTLYDSIVVNTIDEFFAAISNGYNYIIIGDAIKDPLIIAGSMSDIRDDLIIDLNGHEIQRNSRDPLLNVTTGFTLTIIDSEGTGSMYNPVGSVIQVSGGTLTVQNGIFESGPRSDNSRDAKRHNDENEPDYVDVTAYNEYATGSNESGWNALGGGSISGGTSGTAQVTVYRNSNIGSENTSNTYGDSIGTVALPIITPKATGRGVVNGSMYFDDAEEERIYYTCNEYNVIKDDTYLYYTFESDNMQYSTAADKSTANYYYRYYINGGSGDNIDFTYAQNQVERVEGTNDNRILVTVYVFNDVKYYADKQSGYKDSSGTSGFAAVKMQSGNLYVRGGTYYSYFGKDNTFGVQSTGGLMSVNPTGSNAINFYAYQNGVCVECTVDKPTENEMLNISNGNFYSELGDTVRVTNGNLVIGTADFTKNVGNASANNFGEHGNVIDISGGTITIDTRANFNISGSGVRGIYSHDGDNTSVRVANATFTFESSSSTYNCGIYAASGTVTCNGNTTIDLSNGSEHNTGIYSAGGTITCGQNGSSSITTIKIAKNSASTGNYGIYSGGGSIRTYGTTEITLGNTDNQSTSNYGIYSSGGTVTLGNEGTGSAIIKILGSSDNSSTRNNYAAYLVGGGIELNGAEAEMEVYGAHSAGIYTSQAEGGTATTININNQFKCSIVNRGTTLSSAAIIANGGTIGFNLDNSIAEQGYGITSTDLGIVAKSGANVNFISGSLSLTSTRGTSIYVEGGNITIGSEQNNSPLLDVTCQLGQNLHGGDAVTWDGSISTTANRYNAIFVSGGSLISNGTLNVTHHGVENDQSVSGNDAFLKQTVKSFAVRVENSTGVNIAGGEISNAIGGGIYVGGGNVYLGATYSGGKYAQSANADDIKVSTTGAIAGNKIYFNGAATWSYDLLRTGGHAVEVSGGSLTVYGGTYSAAQGNGILVRNTSDSVANVTIEDGTFIGRNGGCGKYGANNKNVGPGVFYGLYVVGGNLNVVINNGTFGELNGESNSGASFYGTYGMSQRATVDIYKGKFYGHSADAISVFRFININIGNHIDINGNAVESDGSEIIIQTDNNDAAPLSAQDNFVEQYDGRGSDINIYYGTFIGGRYDSGGYYNPYLKNNNYDNINEYGRRNTTGNNPDNVKTVFSYSKY